MANFNININLLFRPATGVLPTLEDLYQRLWRFAKLLEDKAGLSLSSWHPPAPTEKDALGYLAFDGDGVTADTIRLAHQYSNPQYADMPNGGAWNGKEGIGSAVFSTMYNPHGPSHTEFSATEPVNLKNYPAVLDLVEGMLQIWPALAVEVGSFKYSSQKQVFPDRPGAGWMLYLPRRIEIEQVPEARMLRHVRDLNGTEGTIMVSEIDELFSADNSDHVTVANQIEIRLADQDLLPKYADL